MWYVYKSPMQKWSWLIVSERVNGALVILSSHYYLVNIKKTRQVDCWKRLMPQGRMSSSSVYGFSISRTQYINY